MWFEDLFGFGEGEVDVVADQFVLDHDRLTSLANGRTLRCGTFETVSLHQLRERVAAVAGMSGSLSVDEVVADVQSLHLDGENAGAAFQVASQFNTLEMVSPSVAPESGIERYASDRTQGPACAIACAAGTLYRNYLIDIDGDGRRGQTVEHQIDCLAPLAEALGVGIEMRNGYALPTEAQLGRVAEVLVGCTEAERESLLARLAIGVQWNTEVTLDGGGHSVTQLYCSAMPVAYSSEPAQAWEPFARLILDAAYEATMAAAVVNASATGNSRLFLTLLGGGAFGNPTPWILDAIERALDRYAQFNLDVRLVSFGGPNPDLGRLVT